MWYNKHSQPGCTHLEIRVYTSMLLSGFVFMLAVIVLGNVVWRVFASPDHRRTNEEKIGLGIGLLLIAALVAVATTALWYFSKT